LATRLPNSRVYLTTRSIDNVQGMEAILRMDIGASSENVRYRKLDVTDQKSINKFADVVKRKHGRLDILVNNAAIYHKPPSSVYVAADGLAVHSREALDILKTNYFGLKSVVKAFYPILGPNARITNIGSHLGTVDRINGEEPSAHHLRKAFTNPQLTEQELDSLIQAFGDSVKAGTWAADGWPTCSYTVSKVAVNAYTGILQRQVDEEKKDLNIAINSVHTGAYHSKMKLLKETTVSQVDGAEAVAYVATLGVPDIGNTHTTQNYKGQVLWHNLNVVDWSEEGTQPQEEEVVESL